MYYIIPARGCGKSFYTMLKTKELQESANKLRGTRHRYAVYDKIIPGRKLGETGLPELDEEIKDYNYKEMKENMQMVTDTLNSIFRRPDAAGCERVNSHIFVPTIDRIYYNTKKRTVVIYWSNGESTKVTCAAGETFDVELGIRLAVCKYVLGNSSTVSKGIIAKAVEKAKNTTKE